MLRDCIIISQLQFFSLFVTGTAFVVLSLIIFYTIRIRSLKKEMLKRNLPGSESGDLKRIGTVSVQPKDLSGEDRRKVDIFYKVLVDSLEDGIAFYDNSSNLRFANTAFYSMIGLDQESYHSRDSIDLIHPDDRDYSQLRMEALEKEGYFKSELRLSHAKGHYVNLSTKSVIVRDDDGVVLGSIMISRDITKLKQAFTDRIKANKEVEATSRLKSSFLANISHEIRTPLNSVVGFSNLLLSDDLTQEAKEEYVDHINFNSDKLLQIIGDIVDLSRLENSQIEISYEETSLNSIIDEIIRETREIIKRNEKPILLNIRNNFSEGGDLIFTDRVWLKRVLHHLMDNAVKFTLDGSIELTSCLESGKIMFRVKDTGIGINKENLSRIFEQFKQEVSGHQRPFDGLGVGLTLAREVVERMGGQIYVQSEKGIGSEFGFWLPYRPAGGTRLRMESLPGNKFVTAKNWSSKKCLLVDDNKDMLLYLERILTDTHIGIVKARSGPEAVQIIKFTPDIDLVLLDMQMPEMNGIEATKEIRRIRLDLPIIAHTAFVFKDDKDIILEAGCDACLIKPIRREQLILAMQGFLNPADSTY